MSVNRRDFVRQSALAAAALGYVPNILIRQERPPNVVVIFIDDLGYADIGSFGADGYVTPHLDQMAADGLRLTDFYCSQAVCSASRASLLTGCYANRVSILGALGPNARHGLNPQEMTIAEVLKQRDYACGIYGKWHLGHHRPFLPLQHGFDDYLGTPYSNDMWPVDFDGRSWDTIESENRPGKASYPPLPLIDGNEKADEIRTLHDQGTLTTRLTERAVRFIDANRNRPFFCYLPHPMVHIPLGVSAKFHGRSAQGLFGDVMMELDWSVGEVFRSLRRHGLEENTFVVFTSDNGPWLNFGNHAGSAFPLREGKGTMWDGGCRVPCLMQWPGHIAPGRVTDRLAGTIDLLPTIAGLAEVPLPPLTIDGVNLRPLLEGREGAEPRTEFWYYYGRQLQAVRQGPWKLHFPHEYRSYEGVKPGRDGWPGPYARGRTGLELYNLADDDREIFNVADQHPEVVRDLQALGNEARAALGDVGMEGTEIRPPGRLPEA